MLYDEGQQVIRCAGCRREVEQAASRLTEGQKARLASFAIRYQLANGLNLQWRRTNGLPAPRDARDI
jgi:hypothetical protein